MFDQTGVGITNIANSAEDKALPGRHCRPNATVGLQLHTPQSAAIARSVANVIDAQHPGNRP